MKSLSTRLTIFLAATLAVSALLLTSLTYLSMRQNVLETLEREVGAATDQQKSSVAAWLASKRRIIEATLPAAFEPDLKAKLQRAAASGAFTNVYVGYPDKSFAQGTDLPLPPTFDPTVRPWWKAVMEKQAMVVTAPFMSVGDKKLVVSVAGPVMRNGQIAAIMSSNTLLDEIVSGVLGMKLVGDSHAFLMGKDGTLIAYRDESAVLKPVTNLMPDLTADRIASIAGSGKMEEVRIGDQLRYLELRQIPDSDWYLGVVVDRAAALAPLNKLLYALIGATLVVLAVVCALAVVGTLRMLKELVSLRQAMQEIAQGAGDLTVRLPVRSEDEVGQAAGAFNQFLERLHTMFREVREQSSGVHGEVGGVAATTSRLALDFNRQTDEMSATAATIEQVTVSINHIADTVRETETAMRTADTESVRTAESVQEVTREISRAAETMGGLSTVVSRLGSRSDEIAGIVGAIRGIADQTNLLALNAAIEAARAGEQGRGFAVVADEVRKLAERTAESTVEIGRMIDAIRSEMSSAVAGMEDAQKIVSSGASLADEASSRIQVIRDRVADVMARIRDISGATTEQATATSEMAKRAEQVHAMIQGSGHALQETERSLQAVNDRANQLGQLVGRFRL